ncbi:MAG: hypothetical protein AB1487_03860, partial [Thermodesulfobacteriota bacterium]
FPPLKKGIPLHSPFEKGGLRGIFEAPFSGRLALFKQLKCYQISNLKFEIKNADRSKFGIESFGFHLTF